MKKCNYCGALLEDDALFCTFCGKKIEYQGNTCPRCGAGLDDESAFCSKCGMKLKTTTEETSPPESELQDVEIPPKKSNSLWYVICSIVCVCLLLTCVYYTLNNLRKPSPKEQNTSDVSANNEKEISLIGDADGFPLKLSLRIVNGEVTGIYKNVTYGTTMIVSGTMDEDVINLEGSADNTNYTFQIIPEGENYTGTFGKVGGKRMNLHLRNCPSDQSLSISDELLKLDSIKKKK